MKTKVRKMEQGEGSFSAVSLTLLVFCLAFALVSLTDPLWSGGKAQAGSLIKKGSEVPRFELPLTGGGNLRLEQELGKVPLLLLYWSLYCESCREDLPKIQKMYDRLGTSRVKILAISGDGRNAAKLVQSYWQRERFTFLSLLDEETQEEFVVERLLGVERTPVVVLVNRAGIVLF
ncbi:MAG: TlpA disulfide reductase family protein, partial [candidate division NC10 bacterium]|nr:TlpA disulfide reductase family protein [candidate division NC10 bacterium]